MAGLSTLQVKDTLGNATSLKPVHSDVMRLTKADLNNLPVRFEEVKTCGCWVGPRNQAQKKFKFRVTNLSEYTLRIGGGTGSSLRLLVAYPASFRPRISMPIRQDAEAMSAAMPAGAGLYRAAYAKPVVPTEMPDAASVFGVPDGWTVWALPPNPHAIVEPQGFEDNMVTFPTYVDQESLEPGASFYQTGYGYGSWVFYVPMPRGLRKAMVWTAEDPDGETFTYHDSEVPNFVSRQFVNVIGIAVVDPSESELLGFAPTPPESMFSSPDDF